MLAENKAEKIVPTTKGKGFLRLIAALLPVIILTLVMLVLGNNNVKSSLPVILLLSALTSVAVLGSRFLLQKGNKELLTIAPYGFIASIFLNLAVSLPIGALMNLGIERLALLFLFAAFGGIMILAQDEESSIKSVGPVLPPEGSLSKAFADSQLYPLIALLGIFVVAIVARSYQIDLLDTYRDEDHHIASARMLLNQGDFEYSRGAIVTYMTALFSWMGGAFSFHDYMVWGRIPSVIIGSLLVIPLYFLGRKIHPIAGLFAAALWAISPWGIGLSRIVREHPYYLMVSMCYALLMLDLAKTVLNYDKKNRNKLIIYAVLILALLIYAFVIDWLSTLKINGVLLAVVSFSYLVAHYEVIVQNFRKQIKLVAGAAVAMILFMIPASRSKFASLDSQTDIRWADTFLNPFIDSPIHWWAEKTGDFYLVYFFLLLGVIGALLLNRRYFFVYLISFLLVVSAYHFFFNRYYAPRYIAFALPFYVLWISGSLYFLFRQFDLIRLPAARIAAKAATGLVMLNLFNFQNAYLAVTDKSTLSSYATKTTGEYHNNKQVVLDFMDRFEFEDLKHDAYITSIYDYCLEHEYGLENIHKYKYKDPNRFAFVDSVVAANTSGWMILDYHRNSLWKQGYPLQEGFTSGETPVKLLHGEDLCYIYRWDKLGFENLRLSREVTAGFDPGVTLDMSKPISISFWNNANLETPGAPFYIGENYIKGISVESDPMFSKGGFMFRYADSGDCYGLETGKINDRKWHHVVWYQEGGGVGSEYGLYIDGEMKSKCAISREKNDLVNFIMGNFNGRLQDLRIYDFALQADQVDAIYNRKDLFTNEPDPDPSMDFEPKHSWMVEGVEIVK